MSQTPRSGLVPPSANYPDKTLSCTLADLGQLRLDPVAMAGRRRLASRGVRCVWPPRVHCGGSLAARGRFGDVVVLSDEAGQRRGPVHKDLHLVA